MEPTDYYFALGTLLVIVGVFLLIALTTIPERNYGLTVIAVLAVALFGVAAAHLAGVNILPWLPKVN